MKDKILAKLKQVYSHLGLGDAILSGQAESLAISGLVTDENLDAVIEAQKAFLEGLQKSNDSRVNEAVKKAKEAAKKEFEQAQKKAAEEAEKKAKEAQEGEVQEPQKKADDGEPEWFKVFVESMKAEQKAKADEYAGLKDSLKKLQEDYEGAKAQAKKQAREKFILDKAKELGVPQYRIDEGFAFGDDVDDASIEASLTTIANNIKANMLPQDKRFRMGDDVPSRRRFQALQMRSCDSLTIKSI